MMIRSIRKSLLGIQLPATFAIGALAILSASAQAADLNEITISAPSVKVVGRDAATNAPIEETTKTATVAVDPVTLTTNSGVALLNDSVRDAAVKVCDSIGPEMDDDGTCVLEAIKSARTQVDATIARARSATNG